jgi:hypothetical protein
MFEPLSFISSYLISFHSTLFTVDDVRFEFAILPDWILGVRGMCDALSSFVSKYYARTFVFHHLISHYISFDFLQHLLC